MNTERKRGGRIPKLNSKSHHVMLRFDDDEWMKFFVMYAVSYTHLTLPTN